MQERMVHASHLGQNLKTQFPHNMVLKHLYLYGTIHYIIQCLYLPGSVVLMLEVVGLVMVVVGLIVVTLSFTKIYTVTIYVVVRKKKKKSAESNI